MCWSTDGLLDLEMSVGLGSSCRGTTRSRSSPPCRAGTIFFFSFLDLEVSVGLRSWCRAETILEDARPPPVVLAEALKACGALDGSSLRRFVMVQTLGCIQMTCHLDSVLVSPSKLLAEASRCSCPSRALRICHLSLPPLTAAPSLSETRICSLLAALSARGHGPLGASYYCSCSAVAWLRDSA